MIDLSKINTEARNKSSMKLDEMNPLEIVKLINEEDAIVQKAVSEQLEQIALVVDCAANAIENSGRIIYIGAGTSGRLGVLDAVECPPTYGVSDELVIGLIAGGEKSFVRAQEGAEDSLDLAAEDMRRIGVNSNDLVIGIAASGRTPYVIGGLKFANQIGCTTASIAVTDNSDIGKISKYPIEVVVGPEVVTGSTRMKAGTAQKMILNMISTGAMVLNGKVYQNLMVDVQQTNEKLVVRAQNIVMEATGVSRERAIDLLSLAKGSAKVAIALEVTGQDFVVVNELLKQNNGKLNKVINHV